MCACACKHTRTFLINFQAEKLWVCELECWAILESSLPWETNEKKKIKFTYVKIEVISCSVTCKLYEVALAQDNGI
jgi:hypothetical protein